MQGVIVLFLWFTCTASSSGDEQRLAHGTEVSVRVVEVSGGHAAAVGRDDGEDKLAPSIRSIVTVTALMAGGVLDGSLQHHIERAKANGVTADEMAEVLTHAAFYAGWPKAWAAFRYAQEIYAC